jgi:hypothetical protein
LVNSAAAAVTLVEVQGIREFVYSLGLTIGEKTTAVPAEKVRVPAFAALPTKLGVAAEVTTVMKRSENGTAAENETSAGRIQYPVEVVFPAGVL